MSDSGRPHRWQHTRLPRPWNSPGKNAGVGCHFLLQCMKVKSEIEASQSCLTLSDPMDCNLPGSSIHGIFQARVQLFCDPLDCSPLGSSVHGILQARILAWVAVSFSCGFLNPVTGPASPALTDGFFTTEPPGKPYFFKYLWFYS